MAHQKTDDTQDSGAGSQPSAHNVDWSSKNEGGSEDTGSLFEGQEGMPDTGHKSGDLSANPGSDLLGARSDKNAGVSATMGTAGQVLSSSKGEPNSGS